MSEVKPKELVNAVKEMLPTIMQGYARTGHRRVRVCMVVESVDPFGGVPGERVQIEKVTLIETDPRDYL